jgi:hypothetical protein
MLAFHVYSLLMKGLKQVKTTIRITGKIGSDQRPCDTNKT